MPKQSEPQKETVGRVMHAFKHGELESSSGKTVRSRKQAIAIALSEAGASNQESPKTNAKAPRRTPHGGATKAELYDAAKRRDIAGRSRMTKAELARAIKH